MVCTVVPLQVGQQHGDGQRPFDSVKSAFQRMGTHSHTPYLVFETSEAINSLWIASWDGGTFDLHCSAAASWVAVWRRSMALRLGEIYFICSTFKKATNTQFRFSKNLFRKHVPCFLSTADNAYLNLKNNVFSITRAVESPLSLTYPKQNPFSTA